MIGGEQSGGGAKATNSRASGILPPPQRRAAGEALRRIRILDWKTLRARMARAERRTSAGRLEGAGSKARQMAGDPAPVPPRAPSPTRQGRQEADRLRDCVAQTTTDHTGKRSHVVRSGGLDADTDGRRTGGGSGPSNKRKQDAVALPFSEVKTVLKEAT